MQNILPYAAYDEPADMRQSLFFSLFSPSMIYLPKVDK